MGVKNGIKDIGRVLDIDLKKILSQTKTLFN